MNRFVKLLAGFSLLLAVRASAADLTFAGNLRFVSASAITVRLSNGIIIDARLPKMGELAAQKISAKYRIADWVQIACKKISPVWDESVGRRHVLELTRIDFVRTPLKEEIDQVIVSLSWQGGDNLLQPVPEAPKPQKATASKVLERVREGNLARAAKMPNFLADEQATRSVRVKGAVNWKQVDIVESEIAFHGDNPTRQTIRINGKPFKTVSGWIPGVNWDIGFGAELENLLDRDCANTFELAGHEEFRGKQVTVYRFNAPSDGCFGPETVNYQQFAAAKTGRILVDDTDGNVIQMEYKDVGTPPELGGGIERSYSWNYVKIGDASYLLPVATDMVWTDPNGGGWHVATQFKNHRHFDASTDITFK